MYDQNLSFNQFQGCLVDFNSLKEKETWCKTWLRPVAVTGCSFKRVKRRKTLLKRYAIKIITENVVSFLKKKKSTIQTGVCRILQHTGFTDVICCF